MIAGLALAANGGTYHGYGAAKAATLVCLSSLVAAFLVAMRNRAGASQLLYQWIYGALFLYAAFVFSLYCEPPASPWASRHDHRRRPPARRALETAGWDAGACADDSGADDGRQAGWLSAEMLPTV